MRRFPALGVFFKLSVPLAATLCLSAQGLPPGTTTDYQAQAKAGPVTLAADFVRHSVPTAQGTLSTEEFVVVELGLFGPPETRMQISMDDFSLRIRRKSASPPYGMAVASLKTRSGFRQKPPARRNRRAESLEAAAVAVRANRMARLPR